MRGISVNENVFGEGGRLMTGTCRPFSSALILWLVAKKMKEKEGEVKIFNHILFKQFPED
jgi:hypothetical protein